MAINISSIASTEKTNISGKDLPVVPYFKSVFRGTNKNGERYYYLSSIGNKKKDIIPFSERVLISKSVASAIDAARGDVELADFQAVRLPGGAVSLEMRPNEEVEGVTSYDEE